MKILVLNKTSNHKLNYDDPISKYFPELVRATGGITIRHLLTHTSGIPDVGDLGIDGPRPCVGRETARNAFHLADGKVARTPAAKFLKRAGTCGMSCALEGTKCLIASSPAAMIV